MILPNIATENTLVADADMLASVADFNDNNDMATSRNAAIEKVNRPSASWQDKMLSNRQHRKSNEKLQWVINRKRAAEFEVSVAEYDLDNLNSNIMESEMPDHPIDWNINSSEPPDLPHPEGWNNTGDISAINSILNSSIVTDRANDARTELGLRNECEAFK